MKRDLKKWLAWGRALPPPARWILTGILLVFALYFGGSLGEQVGRALYRLTH